VAAALLTAALVAATAPWPAGRVVAVSVDAPGARDPQRLAQVIAIRQGDTLSRAELRRAVQALLASREIEDAVATVESAGDGVALTFRLQVANRVGTYRIAGLPRRTARKVRGTLKVIPGGVLAVPVFEAEIARAEGQLRADGYPEARLEPSLDFDLAAGTVDVEVVGALGPPQVVAGVAVDGVDMTAAEVADVCGLKPGRRLKTSVRERARRRLEQHLREQGWWEARALPPEIEPAGGGARVLMRVRPGSRYRLELSGVERSRALEQEALPFLRGDEAFGGDAGEAAEAVRRFLQRRRYLQATASAELVDDDGASVLRLTAVPGPKQHIREVRFPGAATLNAADLGKRVGVQARGLVPWGREPVDDETLAADAASVLAVARRAGLAQATVDRPRVIVEGKKFVVELPVHAGLRHVVAGVRVNGWPAGVTAPEPALAGGTAWSLAAEADACDALAATLRDAAYLDAWVESRHECADGRCSVDFAVHAGDRTVLDRVVVAGIARTRPDVPSRIAHLESAAPLGASALLEAQRRLLQLGIFEQASLRPVPGQAPDAPRAYVLDLQEAPTRALSYGIEWDSIDQTRISLSWSQLSLLGSGRSLSFNTDFARNDQDFEVLYREPLNLGVLHIPTWMSLYRTEDNRIDYTVLRRGYWIEVGDRWRKPVRLVPRLEYQLVSSDAPPEDESELEREDQTISIMSITPILEWDTRDDQLSPRRGAYVSLQPQYAFPAFQADAQFNKVTLLASAYRPTGKSVVAGSLRIGGITPTTPETQDSDTPDNLKLPIAVRYFAGGRISNRAFPTDRLGADGTFDSNGTPIGGAGMLLANLELRFRVMGQVGGSLFVDGGNVWPSWRDISIPGMRWGAGVGVRVETPAGPFRVEYGWKLDRLPGESSGELFFSFGNPF
jgi:outer membrane protein insertion porin family